MNAIDKSFAGGLAAGACLAFCVFMFGKTWMDQKRERNTKQPVKEKDPADWWKEEE